ncbi:CpsD/CapB family tyrosine-protein kinase [Roseivivax sp. THAF30]|uniref:CpsD/CapB family tyrosine-protein kinase n=1 Tax=Roseivivax sp. THAF30 TaxID=2587852 RepID=UPI001268C477|nr:CpsD/CapB family tyrosine-protein kinase [Roseivivax sp. THAF30]QFT61388.1 Tyrosine-protein kinase YwqD [Roseivivax sp. THAF30]
MSADRTFRRKNRPVRAREEDDMRPVAPLERPKDRVPQDAAPPASVESGEARDKPRTFRRKNPPRRTPEAQRPAGAPEARPDPADKEPDVPRKTLTKPPVRLEPEMRQDAPTDAAPEETPPSMAEAQEPAALTRADELNDGPATAPAMAPPAERTATPVTRSLSESAADQDANWRALDTFRVDERLLDRNRIITASRYDPAHSSFDVLRTRLLQALAERGWTRIAITSPTQGCGKTFTAANLAISLARQENCRTILFDTDLRNPSLSKVFGLSGMGPIGNLLRGASGPEDHLLRLGPNAIHASQNLAIAFNDAPETYASELLQDPRTGHSLNHVQERYRPDVMLFDMPPALYGDDVIAMRPHIDAVILVVGGGLTSEREIREVEARLGTETPLLGVVLNRAEGSTARKYTY